MQDKILYFQCNDRQPTPKEANKFIAHIRGDLFANEDDRYGICIQIISHFGNTMQIEIPLFIFQIKLTITE